MELPNVSLLKEENELVYNYERPPVLTFIYHDGTVKKFYEGDVFSFTNYVGEKVEYVLQSDTVEIGSIRLENNTVKTVIFGDTVTGITNTSFENWIVNGVEKVYLSDTITSVDNYGRKQIAFSSQQISGKFDLYVGRGIDNIDFESLYANAIITIHLHKTFTTVDYKDENYYIWSTTLYYQYEGTYDEFYDIVGIKAYSGTMGHISASFDRYE